MPEIPLYLAQRQLGLGAGTPQGQASLRTIAQPTTSPGPFTAGAEGLAAVGASLRETGARLSHYARQQQEAQDKIAIEKATQTFLQRYDAGEQALHQQAMQGSETEGGLSLLNPQARGDRALQLGRDVIGEVGQGLTARQRGIFEADSARYLTARVRHVRDQAQAEFVRDAQQTIDASVQFHTQAAINAPDHVQAALHLDNIQRVLGEGVATGTIVPAKQQQLYDQALRTVQIHDAQIALRSDPAQAVQDLHGLLTGEGPTPPLLEALAKAPRDSYAKLYDEAQQQLHRQVTQREHLDVKARRDLQDRQGQVASTHRAALYRPGITIPEILAQIQPINEDRQAQRLSEQDHTSLLTTAQALMEKLRADALKDQDVPAIRQELSYLVETAETPAQLAAAQAQIRAQAPNLSAATFQGFLARVDARREQSAYTNRDAYKEGRQLILGAAFPGGIVQATLDKLDEATKAKVSIALDIYAETMQTVYEQQGRPQGDTQAREKARALRDLYFPLDDKNARLLPGLPVEFQGLPYDEAAARLDRLDVTPALKRELYLKIQQLRKQFGTGLAPDFYAEPIGPSTARGVKPKRGEAPK